MGRPSPYTSEVEALIISGYLAGKSTHELVATYGGSRDTLVRRLEQAGVTMRTREERQQRLPCREDAFADATTDDEAAYWVGFLMADGCVSIVKNSAWVILQLAVCDASHVNLFCTFLNSSHKISQVRPHAAKGFGDRQDCVRIAIGSHRMADDLAKYGVVPRKSKTARVSLLSDNRHFWRGVIDGDGCLGRCTFSVVSPLLQVCGSEPLMKQFQSYAHAITGTNAKVHPSHGCWGFGIGMAPAARMIAHLYTDCTVALRRKWEKAHELLCAWELRENPRGRRRPVSGCTETN